MGIWKGIYQAHMAAKEIDLRKEERAQDIALRQKERAEDRANALEMYRLKALEDKREVIVNAYLEFAKAKRDSQVVTAEAQDFLSRLEGIDDPRVDLFRAAPGYAARAEKALLEEERKRQEAGITGGIPLRGAPLLDLVRPPSNTDNPLTIPPDDLFELDFNDPLVFAETMAALTPPAQQEPVLSPELSFVPNPKVFEEARAAFDSAVLSKAFTEQAAVAEDSPEWSELQKLIENFDKKDSPAHQQLRDRFGLVAMAELIGSDSPYVAQFLDAPDLAPYKREIILRLQQGLSDPNVSEADKARARQKLAKLNGITF